MLPLGMGAHDELRDALQRRKALKADECARQAAFDLLREQYENEETEIRQRLHEMATLTLEALLRLSKPERIALEAGERKGRRLIRSTTKHVYGWRVALGNREREILCDDGRLISLDAVSGDPRFSTLHAWIDQRIRNVRDGDEPSSGPRFDRAFSIHAWRPEAQQGELKQDLLRIRKSVADHLAEILHERGLSI